MDHEFTRRAWLKSMAAIPLVSALSPLTASSFRKPTVDLNLWFHGLFAFVIKRDYIAVLTPKVADHRYLAGLWKQEQKLHEGEWYRLSGVSDPAHPNPFPELSPAKMPFLSGVKSINMAASYFLLRLPFPRQIVPLRYVKADFSGAQAPKQSVSQTFPTVQLMRYKVTDYNNLRIDPFEPWTKQRRPPAIINFHIFAEPDYLPPPAHALSAFDGLVRLFPGVDLKLTDSSAACFPLDLNLPPGVDPKQQVSLAERKGDCDRGSGGRTANCFIVIVDDRDPAP